MQEHKKEEQEKRYIGRLKETELIQRTSEKPLTNKQKDHNLEAILKYFNRPKLVRKDNVGN